tara:strand:- start:490 stop:729 length:240 start_codon:yes stop_codon:yes gene_type:complete
MLLEEILLAVLWAMIITLFITLHRLGRLLDNMLVHVRMAKVDVRELQDMIQQKIDEENREKAIDDFIDELNKKHNEDKK